MVNFYIYAKDFSGSTGGDQFFHCNGMKTLNQFKGDVENIKKDLLDDEKPPTESKIIYLHWGDTCFEVNEHTTVSTYTKLQCGYMGTEPSTIIEWIQQHYDITDENNTIQLLYIITDGLIDYNNVDKCFKLNENMHYETVVFHAINANVDCIDLSVAASFFKSNCRVFRNNELSDNINIGEEFTYHEINIDNILDKKENLKSYIQLKFINKFKHDAQALQEIDNLKKLRDRLFMELSKPTEEVKLDIKNRDEFLNSFVTTDWYKNLNAANHDLKVEIEKLISTLINYIVSDSKSYSFDALKFDTKFNNPVEEEPIADIDFTNEKEIEFPDIILDEDKGVPVIILTEFNLLDKIIFHRTEGSDAVSPASFNKFKSAMECPLFLLNDPDISESIGYFYTLEVYKKLLEKTEKTEPRTRRRFHGGIVILDKDNTYEIDKYNDYILSATYFDSKRIHYNIGLFYYVLWKNCENKEWMDRNVVEQLKKYAMKRISRTVCKIGMSSLPLDPQNNTSLLTALWYCLELSSCIFKNDPQNFMHERLRMYYGVAPCMIEILEYFNYDLDIKSIKKRNDLITHVMLLKKNPTHEEKHYYILERMFKNINGFLVCEIEKPSELNKLNYLKLNHKGMLSDEIIDEKVYLSDYVHLLYFVDDTSKTEDSKTNIKICEKTCRPYFTIDKNKSFYTELAKITKKVVIKNDGDKNDIKIAYDALDVLQFDKILSTYNLFINCVKDNRKYPTLTEYIEYISKKKKFHGDLVTIFPPNVYSTAKDAYARYQSIVTKVDVNKFIEVTKSYVKRTDRIKAEKRIKFNNDNEVDEYISKQEAKVNLKKRKLN